MFIALVVAFENTFNNRSQGYVILISFLQHVHYECAVSFHLQSSDTTINTNCPCMEDRDIINHILLLVIEYFQQCKSC